MRGKNTSFYSMTKTDRSVFLILNPDNYDHLINALAEADQWTGFPYSQKVFENARIIKN